MRQSRDGLGMYCGGIVDISWAIYVINGAARQKEKRNIIENIRGHSDGAR